MTYIKILQCKAGLCDICMNSEELKFYTDKYYILLKKYKRQCRRTINDKCDTLNIESLII